MMRRREKPAYVQKQEEAERKRHEAEIHQDNNQIVAALDRATDAINAYRDEQTSQDRLSNFLEIAGIGGIYLAAGVAIWAICAASIDSDRQRTVMQGQLDQMRAEQRPWVYADVPVLNATIHRNMVGAYEADLTFKLRSVGHLPGFYAQVAFKAPLPNGMHVGNIQKIQHETCRPGSPVAPNVDGDTVFPGQVILENPRTGIDVSNWRPDDGVLIWIIGCVVYQFPESATQHFSRFVYQIHLKNPPPFPTRLTKFPDELTPDQVDINAWPDKDAFTAD